MTRFIALIGFAFLAACSAQNDTPNTAQKTGQKTGQNAGAELTTDNAALAEDARLAAVLVYADWCSSCKIIDPKIAAAKAAGPMENVSFVTLDYTDRNAHAFFQQADQLGIGAPIRAQLEGNVKTGILLLVDLDDQKVVGDLRKELSAQDIRSQIISAANAA